MNIKKVMPLASGILLAAGLSACMPAHLQKYRKDSAAKSPQGASAIPDGDTSLPPTRGSDTTSAPQMANRARTESPSPGPAARDGSASAGARATIYAVDRQTYRFALREGDIWDAALNVLLKNYNLTIVDRQSGIITTEWDSFYLNGAVFRNRVSMRVSRSAWNNVDVTIVNNVERLRDAAQAAGAMGAVWLPADDPANEVARIVQNMSLVLNQPPPVLPPNTGIVKKSGDDAKVRY